METKPLNEKETLQSFFDILRVKDCTYEDVKKFICISQQIESKIVGKRMV